MAQPYLFVGTGSSATTPGFFIPMGFILYWRRRMQCVSICSPYKDHPCISGYRYHPLPLTRSAPTFRYTPVGTSFVELCRLRRVAKIRYFFSWSASSPPILDYLGPIVFILSFISSKTLLPLFVYFWK